MSLKKPLAGQGRSAHSRQSGRDRPYDAAFLCGNIFFSCRQTLSFLRKGDIFSPALVSVGFGQGDDEPASFSGFRLHGYLSAMQRDDLLAQAESDS